MTAAIVRTAQDAKGEYRDMLVRLMTRQFYAETATAEVFGRSIGCAPTLREKFLAAEFAEEEAEHSQRLCNLFRELGIDPEKVHAARPPAAQFWSLDLDNWIHIAVFNFTVDRAGSHQIMEYRDSTYRPWAEQMESVLRSARCRTRRAPARCRSGFGTASRTSGSRRPAAGARGH